MVTHQSFWKPTPQPYRTIHHTAYYVALGPGICVMLELLVLKKKVVYVGSIIEKYHYSPMLIASDPLDWYFDDKEGGTVPDVKGKHDGLCYNVAVMKDASYLTKIMVMAFSLSFLMR